MTSLFFAHFLTPSPPPRHFTVTFTDPPPRHRHFWYPDFVFLHIQKKVPFFVICKKSIFFCKLTFFCDLQKKVLFCDLQKNVPFFAICKKRYFLGWHHFSQPAPPWTPHTSLYRHFRWPPSPPKEWRHWWTAPYYFGIVSRKTGKKKYELFSDFFASKNETGC